MNHLPYAHLRDDLPYPRNQNVRALDCPRALLIVEKCSCGAYTVRPQSDALSALMEAEWGVKQIVDEDALARVMAIAYDPTERDDIASREVWPEAVPV